MSPSVTATSRILSPKRITFRFRLKSQAAATFIQSPMRFCTFASLQCPAITLRASRIRAPIKPCSRSPWALWCRFM